MDNHSSKDMSRIESKNFRVQQLGLCKLTDKLKKAQDRLLCHALNEQFWQEQLELCKQYPANKRFAIWSLGLALPGIRRLVCSRLRHSFVFASDRYPSCLRFLGYKPDSPDSVLKSLWFDVIYVLEEICFSQLTIWYALAGLLRHTKPHYTYTRITRDHNHLGGVGPSPMKRHLIGKSAEEIDADKVSAQGTCERSPLAPSPFLLPLQNLFHQKIWPCSHFSPLLPASPHFSPRLLMCLRQ